MPKKMNKTELKAKLRQINEILNSLESTEISPAKISALNDFFFQEDEMKKGYQEQLDRLIEIIEYIQSRIKVMQQRAKSIFQIIETDTTTARCLEQYLIKHLKDREIEYFETKNHSLEIVLDSSQRELVINKGVSVVDVPEEYQKIFLKIDDYSVRKALESGEKLDFASLSELEYKLRIQKD